MSKRDQLQSVIDGGKRKTFAALKARIAELEAAIRAHRERLFGDRPVTHDAHIALYAVLREEVKG